MRGCGATQAESAVAPVPHARRRAPIGPVRGEGNAQCTWQKCHPPPPQPELHARRPEQPRLSSCGSLALACRPAQSAAGASAAAGGSPPALPSRSPPPRRRHLPSSLSSTIVAGIGCLRRSVSVAGSPSKPPAAVASLRWKGRQEHAGETVGEAGRRVGDAPGSLSLSRPSSPHPPLCTGTPRPSRRQLHDFSPRSRSARITGGDPRRARGGGVCVPLSLAKAAAAASSPVTHPSSGAATRRPVWKRHARGGKNRTREGQGDGSRLGFCAFLAPNLHAVEINNNNTGAPDLNAGGRDPPLSPLLPLLLQSWPSF